MVKIFIRFFYYFYAIPLQFYFYAIPLQFETHAEKGAKYFSRAQIYHAGRKKLNREHINRDGHKMTHSITQLRIRQVSFKRRQKSKENNNSLKKTITPKLDLSTSR